MRRRPARAAPRQIMMCSNLKSRGKAYFFFTTGRRNDARRPQIKPIKK